MIPVDTRKNPITGAVAWADIDENLIVEYDPVKKLHKLQLSEYPKENTLLLDVLSPSGEIINPTVSTSPPTPTNCRVDYRNNNGFIWCHADNLGWSIRARYKGGGWPMNVASVQAMQRAAVSDPPVGALFFWDKDLAGTPSPGETWAECSGQLISDIESPYDGLYIPNYNGVPVACDTTLGDPWITNIGNRDSNWLFVGMSIVGAGIPANSYIKTIQKFDSGNRAEIGDSSGSSVNATATATVPVTFGNGYFLRGGQVSQICESDAIKAHEHDTAYYHVQNVGDTGTTRNTLSDLVSPADYGFVKGACTDGINGPIAQSFETRPAAARAVIIMRIK